MYGLPASQTAPTQMYGSPQPLYSSAPAGMGQHQPHQQTRPSPNYPQFRAPTGAAYVVLLQARPFFNIIIIIILQASSLALLSIFSISVYLYSPFFLYYFFPCLINHRTMMNGAMTSTSTVAQTNQMPPSTLSLDYFMLLQTLGTQLSLHTHTRTRTRHLFEA